MVLKAIFFDLDDTLVATSDCDARAYLEVAAVASGRLRSEINVNKLIEDFKKSLEHSPWCPDMSVDVDEWRGRLWSSALCEQGVKHHAELGRELHEKFNHCRLANFSFLPEVPQIIQQLLSKNIRVAIITNGHHRVQREKLSACKANLLFPEESQIIIGGEEELAGRKQKPAAEIFFRACRATFCKPEEAIHVGDNLLTDVQARWLIFPKSNFPEFDVMLSSIFTTSNTASGWDKRWVACNNLDKQTGCHTHRCFPAAHAHVKIYHRARRRIRFHHYDMW